MNESYMEYLVRVKRSPLHKTATTACIGVTAVFFLVGFVIPIAFIPAVGFGIGSYFLQSRSILEYEYLYLDKEITIDKIIGLKKRKRVVRIKMEQVTVFAPLSSTQAKDAIAYANGKDYDYSSTDPATSGNCYVLVTSDGSKYILEPSREFVELARMSAPRKVFL